MDKNMSILSAIANTSIYPYELVEEVWNELQSYDAIIRFLYQCDLHNIRPIKELFRCKVWGIDSWELEIPWLLT